jgi:pimeloyl-ACP methyl ester carboxylesterase
MTKILKIHLQHLRAQIVIVTSASSVISRDGTPIGYRVIGQGPGIVILHGAMESSSSHAELAAELADAFTVYLPDRRGRGLSGPYGPGHDMAIEIADLLAVLDETGASNVLGVSSGALVALEAAAQSAQIRRAAIFESPLVIGDSASTSFVVRYHRELASGALAAALVTGMKGAKMGPPIFDYVPRPVLRALTALMIRHEERAAGEQDVTMRSLAPTLGYDFGLVEQCRDRVDAYAGLRADVLLLGGERSPAYLRTAMDALAATLPQARRIVFAGLGHGATGNARFGGSPALVGAALRNFFTV